MNPYLNDAEVALVEALRSGRYQQTKGCLIAMGADKVVSHCCLGVACDLSRKGQWMDYRYQDNTRAPRGEADCSDVYLTYAVQQELGWSRAGLLEFAVRNDSVLATLALLNDFGFSFSQLADIIEAGLVEKSKEVK